MGLKTGRKPPEGLFGIFGDDPFLPNEKRFSVESVRLIYPDDYLNVAWAIGQIQEYCDQRRRGVFIPAAYRPEPKRGVTHDYMTEARRRGGRAAGANRQRSGNPPHIAGWRKREQKESDKKAEPGE